MGETDMDSAQARQAAMKARILASVAKEPPPPMRSAVSLRNTAIVVASFAVAFAIFWQAGNVREWHAPPADGPARPLALMAITVVSSAGIAAVALRVAWARAGSMLGAPDRWRYGLLIGAPAGLWVMKVASSYAFQAADAWATRPGLKCFELSTAIGSAIFLGLLFTRRGTALANVAMTGAALGIAAGSAAAVLADLWCPVGHPLHVLVGHVAPMAMFGVLGWGPGRYVLEWQRK